MKSIQSKFLTIVISGMLVLAIAITALSVVYISGILEKDSNAITENVAEAETLRINEILTTVENSVQLMVKYASTTLPSSDALVAEKYIADYNNDAKQIFQAIVNNCDGALSYFLRFDPELAGSTAGFYVSRANTNSGFHDEPTSDLTNYETDPALFWFKQPKLERKAMWSEPYIDATTGLELLTYVTPVYVDYQFVGVLGIDIAFSEITDMVSNISVNGNGFAYLAGRDGSTVEFSPVDSHTLNRAHSDHKYAESRKTLGNGFTLVVHVDYSDIQEDANRVVWMILVIFIILMACFVVLTYILTKRIVKPLKNLITGAEGFQDGQFDVVIEATDSNDEVSSLARALEKTAVKMKGYTSYIGALAYKDTLTGVKNHAAYTDFTNNIDMRIKSGECEPFALLVADINGLKAANDKYGHETGNKLIIKSAKAICDAFKRSPVFRIGGDEFAAVLRAEDYESYNELLENMDRACESSPIVVEDGELEVSVARAVAVFDVRMDTSFDDVFKRADRKMYAHKRQKKAAEIKNELFAFSGK